MVHVNARRQASHRVCRLHFLHANAALFCCPTSRADLDGHQRELALAQPLGCAIGATATSAPVAAVCPTLDVPGTEHGRSATEHRWGTSLSIVSHQSPHYPNRISRGTMPKTRRELEREGRRGKCTPKRGPPLTASRESIQLVYIRKKPTRTEKLDAPRPLVNSPRASSRS